MSETLAPLRQRGRGHDPGRVVLDLAVVLADGGEAIADLAVLCNQSVLFGAVASDATAWRVLDGIDAVAVDRIRAARARARGLAWAQAAETGRLTSSMGGRLVAFSPGGRTLATAIDNRAVILWDLTDRTIPAAWADTLTLRRW
jgi:hypothetical protein